jgi:hypothetical protein
MSDIDHEAAKAWAEFHQQWDCLPRQHNLSRAYLDLSAQVEAERERLMELDQENAALRARMEELAEMLRRCVSAGQGVVE